MKSIAYKNYDDHEGCYDFEVVNGDFKIMKDEDGMNSLAMDLLTTIMTRKDEIMNVIGYGGFGCEIHDIPKAMNTKMTHFLIKEYIKEAISDISRISTIKDVMISNDGSEDELKVNIIIEADDGKTYNIGV